MTVTGLKIKVPFAELQKHLKDRASYHRERADTKSKELPQLKEAMDRLKVSGPATALRNMGKSNYAMDPDQPVESLESDIKDHTNKALIFDFFAGHLFEEDYILEETDLRRLEIVK